MKRTIRSTIIVIVLASVALIFFNRITSDKNDTEVNFAEAKQGSFEISVSSTGELIPEQSMDIRGPNIVQNRYFRIAPLKITDLVPEGTIVRKGDYVATLDKTSFDNTLKDEKTTLNDLQAQFDMKILDTAVVLSTLRDDIRNQIFDAEEASIVVDESKFEPPATQRQAELKRDMAQRLLEQKRRIYSLRIAETSLETRKLRLSLQEQRTKVKNLQEILAAFTVTAPSDGMVAYKKDRTGAKIKTGSMMNPFDPVIATLPDLSSLDSKTYVSEVDINKVKTGQRVEIGIDAFQGKTFTGHVASIANIGETLQNSDSKVFEIQIRIDDTDLSLKPSMTTSNKIVIAKFENVVFVPLEAVHAGPDSIPYVYTSDRTRQVVLLGRSNDKNIIVEKGLSPGTTVHLEIPENSEKFTLAGSDLIPAIRERNNAKRRDSDKTMKEPGIIAATGRLSSE